MQLTTPALNTETFQEDGSNYSSESDTESTASSIDFTSKQPFIKVVVKCFKAPHILKENLLKHLEFNNLNENVTNLKWNTARSGKGYFTLHVSPPEVGESAIAMLHKSLLLGKYELHVQKQKHPRKKKDFFTKETQVSQSDNQPSKRTKVFVGSLPKFVKKSHLKEHFSSFRDKIEDVYIVNDTSKQSKGFGFVIFIDRISANSALSMMNNSLLLNKHRIVVKLAKGDIPGASSIKNISHEVVPDEDISDSESVSTLPDGEECQLFINSKPPLTDKITNKQIADHFSSYKVYIKSAKVIKDKERKSKGYAIITFTNVEVAKEATMVYDRSVFLGTFKLEVHIKQGEKKAACSRTKTSEIKQSCKNLTISPLTEIPCAALYSAQEKAQHFTVKLTCLPPNLTTVQLTALLRNFGELLVPIKIFESKNRYALANFYTLGAAQRAVNELDKTVLDDYTIKVSLKMKDDSKSSEPQTPVTPTPNSIPATAPFLWMVSLDNVDSLISDEELKMMIGVPIHKLDRLTSPSSRVMVYVSTCENAHSVVHKLNDKPCLGKTIEANVVDIKATVPYHHQHSFPAQVTDIQTYRKQSKTPQLSLSSPPVSVPISLPLPSSFPSCKDSLLLSPADWNRLMISGPSGRLLYQDVIEPYKTNPDIHITEDISNRTVFFTGLPEAVNSAYTRVATEVFKELIVEDR